MDILFWIGMAVFALGFILRYVFKFRYYRDYKADGHTEMRKKELNDKYRPLVFIGLGTEVAGCIITFLSIFLS